MTTAPSKFARGTDYQIRDVAPTGDELGFILDTWRWSTLRAHANHGVAKETHFAEITPRILATVARSRARIAHDVDNEMTFLGWALIEGTTLHYVLVRSNFRGHGIARALLDGQRIETFSAKPVEKFRGAPAGWHFNPWAFVPIAKE